MRQIKKGSSSLHKLIGEDEIPLTKKHRLHTFAICAYKESPYLEECIKSVILQKVHSEIILSTSTPNDHIRNLSNRYSILMYVNEQQGSTSGDWEYAVEKAQTPLVTIAHQDDVYFEDYSGSIIKEYLRRKRPLILFTDYLEIRNAKYIRNNKLLQIKRFMLAPLKVRSFQSNIWLRRRILSFGSAICCPSVAYVPDNLEKPLFLTDFKTDEDWEAWERFSRLEGEFVYIPKPLMAHRIHSDSETSAMIADGVRSKEDLEMYCRFWPKPIALLLAGLYKNSEKIYVK